ncbi:hypothetical protein K501DRAFT_296391 [Backusella circina FSU 941]|nr:hypothetical protein K501DRAFT_296391 [Backusella circina FSU 941]
MLENRELEKKKSRTKLLKEGKSGDRLLAAQLQHSQNQVRLLKSTMEQFLRMGVFSDDHLQFVSPTSSIETVVSELRSGRSRHRRTAPPQAATPATPTPITPTPANNKPAAKAEEKQPETVKKSESNSKQPQQEPKQQEPKPLSEKKDDELTTTELDLRLRELLREKEILQAEYSKAPSSGGNALVRRRREELESRLDSVDSQMCRIKLKIRNRII